MKTFDTLFVSLFNILKSTGYVTTSIGLVCLEGVCKGVCLRVCVYWLACVRVVNNDV